MTANWYAPAASDPPDLEFRETLSGGHALVLEYAAGHALVVEYGDCEFIFSSECNEVYGTTLRPDKPWAPELFRWVEHHDAGHRTIHAHCQCGKDLGQQWPDRIREDTLNDLCGAWERHTMTELETT